MHIQRTTIFLVFFIASRLHAQSTLDFKKIHHSQITIERGIYSLFIDNDTLWQAPAFGDFVIKTNYKKNGISSEKAFGMEGRSTSDSVRLKISNQKTKSFIRGLFRSGNFLMVLDPSLRRLHQLNLETTEWRITRDIMFDTMDTKSNLRVKKAFQNSDPKKIWFSDVAVHSETELFVLTYIPGIPLAKLSCDSQGLGTCLFKSICPLPGSMTKSQNDLVGIAYSKKRQQLLIGNEKTKRLEVYEAKGCDGLKLQRAIFLPKELKKMTSIEVDDQDNLWIATAEPDNYLNASTYVWKAEDW